MLRGGADTTFLTIGGRAPNVPAGVRYVITLDADTRLPRGTAKRLVGKMAHPLNRPRLDADTCRVVEGYAVLQPRVTPSLPSGREGSLFQRVFTSPSGLDPYAFAVSDVYQDLFGEGSYSGKGIYDVDAFEAALDGRIPESVLLSHDLLEGIFARAALVSDIEVVEEFPSRYDVAAARQHRWARGDWQLLPWIFARGRDSNGGQGRSAIPLIGRWKMLDNLRRTLSAPATFLALLAGWLLPSAAAEGLDRVRGCDDRDPGPAARYRRDRAAKARHLTATALARGRRGFRTRAVTDSTPGHVPRSSGVADDRRHRANALPSAGQPSATAGVGRRRSGEVQRPAGCSRVLLSHGRRRRARRCGRRHHRVISAWVMADRCSIYTPVGALAGDRAMGGSSTAMAGANPVSDENARALRLIARRTWRFFENLRHGGRSYASTGQFPGGSQAGVGPSDVPYEPGTVPSVGGRRPRFRMAGYA